MTGEKLSISGPAGAVGQSAPRAAWASKTVGLGVSLLLGGLQLAAVLSPREDWPFTSAPMFARHQDLRAPVYYIEWYVRRGEERQALAPRDHLGIGELPFRRGYFAAYYGSADPRHPGGHFPGDDEASFFARQTDYCRRLRAAWGHKARAPAPVFELVVAEELGGQRARASLIGRCEAGGFVRPP